MSDIKNRIEEASAAYYQGNPIISDAEFDALVTQAELSGEYVKEVGFGYTPASRKVSLKSPMLSLDKISNDSPALKRWMQSIQTEFSHAQFYVEPKWDGLSIQTVFEAGELVFAATRGNGVVGEDVLEMASHIQELMDTGRGMDTGTLNGEVVVTHQNLRRINEETEAEYKNTRNTAAGLLRRLDDTDSAQYLSFRPHDGTLRDASADPDVILQAVADMAAGRSAFSTSIDGAVIKVVADGDIREELGYTSSAPRWAVAFKFEAQVYETRLVDIEWSVGRTGRLIPTAVFEPVNMDGAVTQRATLHNAQFMQDMELAVDDAILVQRSGDVIPYVLGKAHV